MNRQAGHFKFLFAAAGKNRQQRFGNTQVCNWCLFACIEDTAQNIWQQALFQRGDPLLIFPVGDGWSDERSSQAFPAKAEEY